MPRRRQCRVDRAAGSLAARAPDRARKRLAPFAGDSSSSSAGERATSGSYSSVQSLRPLAREPLAEARGHAPVRRDAAPAPPSPRGRWRTRSSRDPLCPRTQVHCTSCRRAARDAGAFQSSRFSIGPSFRVQPRTTQPVTHSRMPLTRYWESDTMSDLEPGAFPGQELERRGRAGERHPVVGRGGRVR